MKVNNGQYILMVGDRVVQYLGKDPEEATKYLMTYYSQNKSKRPDAYLVQVHATLEYPSPLIKTMAHEVMT